MGAVQYTAASASPAGESLNTLDHLLTLVLLSHSVHWNWFVLSVWGSLKQWHLCLLGFLGTGVAKLESEAHLVSVIFGSYWDINDKSSVRTIGKCSTCPVCPPEASSQRGTVWPIIRQVSVSSSHCCTVDCTPTWEMVYLAHSTGQETAKIYIEKCLAFGAVYSAFEIEYLVFWLVNLVLKSYIWKVKCSIIKLSKLL